MRVLPERRAVELKDHELAFAAKRLYPVDVHAGYGFGAEIDIHRAFEVANSEVRLVQIRTWTLNVLVKRKSVIDHFDDRSSPKSGRDSGRR